MMIMPVLTAVMAIVLTSLKSKQTFKYIDLSILPRCSRPTFEYIDLESGFLVRMKEEHIPQRSVGDGRTEHGDVVFRRPVVNRLGIVDLFA